MPAVLQRPHFIVLDACVLMSGVLRPALLTLAESGRFIPVWTERIGMEWRRNATRLWPIPPDVLQAEWALMGARFPAADPGDTAPYEAVLRYSDPKDWHVIAAGLAARARCGLQMPPQVSVLTWNLKDFNRSELRRQGLDLYDPDRLLSLWWQEDSSALHEVLTSTLAELAGAGRARQGGLPDVLRRERLYRLARLAGAFQTCAA